MLSLLQQNSRHTVYVVLFTKVLMFPLNLPCFSSVNGSINFCLSDLLKFISKFNRDQYFLTSYFLIALQNVFFNICMRFSSLFYHERVSFVPLQIARKLHLDYLNSPSTKENCKHYICGAAYKERSLSRRVFLWLNFRKIV